MSNDRDIDCDETEAGTPDKCWLCRRPAVVCEYVSEGMWAWACEKCVLDPDMLGDMDSFDDEEDFDDDLEDE